MEMAGEHEDYAHADRAVERHGPMVEGTAARCERFAERRILSRYAGGSRPGPGTSSSSSDVTADPSPATSRAEIGDWSLRRRAIRGGLSEIQRSPHLISAQSATASS